MPLPESGTTLLADAIELLREADRLHRQFFTFPLGASGPCWSPPVDIIERDDVLTIRVALPGVVADAITVSTDGRSLHVSATRPLDARARDKIHMLEIPYGRFERRIELPAGRFELDGRALTDGCLVLRLKRLA